MITLTSPVMLPSTLGNSTGTTYDRLDVIGVLFDIIAQTISGTCQLVSSVTPTSPPVFGTFTIFAGAAPTLSINLAFTPPISILLTAPQNAALLAGVTNAQTQIENALLNTGAVSGVQSAGL
jgi:hypothetical protein